MPAEPTKLPDEVDRPKKNHLALVGRDGSLYAIPVGTLMMIVSGDRPEDHQAVILHKVERTKLHFHCGCGKPGCSRIWKFSVTAAQGTHPK